MKVVEIFTGCFTQPIRLLCVASSLFPDTIRIVVSDDDAPRDTPRYVLQIPCREAHMKGIAHLHSLHDGPDAEGGGIPLAEDGESLCIHHERCPLRLLTVEELLVPFAIDELTADQPATDTHRYH